jgi:hypothetical protein
MAYENVLIFDIGGYGVSFNFLFAWNKIVRKTQIIHRKVLPGARVRASAFLCLHVSLDVDFLKSFFFKVLGVMLSGIVGVRPDRQ